MKWYGRVNAVLAQSSGTPRGCQRRCHLQLCPQSEGRCSWFPTFGLNIWCRRRQGAHEDLPITLAQYRMLLSGPGFSQGPPGSFSRTTSGTVLHRPQTIGLHRYSVWTTVLPLSTVISRLKTIMNEMRWLLKVPRRHCVYKPTKILSQRESGVTQVWPVLLSTLWPIHKFELLCVF